MRYMHLQIKDELVPGTILKRSEVDNLTGLDFLKKIFFISDGVMLTQIRDVSGVDGSTLQNWTKRGWVANSRLKRYDINQVAHILIINMLRSCMQLDKIAFLIEYINGSVDDRSDDIIDDAELYDYICRILDALTSCDTCSSSSIIGTIKDVTEGYEEKQKGAKVRLTCALEIIIVAYYASLLKKNSDAMLEELTGKSSRR